MKVIIVIALMFLLVGCATQTIETSNEDGVFETASDSKLFEVRLNGATFSPDTIIVNQGDTVRFVFMNEAPYTFTLEGYGLYERVAATHIDFVANQKGSFDFECVECNTAGILVVQ
jgi:plastocyanin